MKCTKKDCKYHAYGRSICTEPECRLPTKPAQNWQKSEVYVPALHNPQVNVRPGADAYKTVPSVGGISTTYHDRGHA